MKILVGLGPRSLPDAPLDGDLAFQFRPEKGQPGSRIGLQVGSLPAQVIREKEKPARVDPLQQDDTGRRLALAIDGGQAHRVGVLDPGLDRLGQPPVELRDGIGVQVAPAQVTLQVFLAHGGYVGRFRVHFGWSLYSHRNYPPPKSEARPKFRNPNSEIRNGIVRPGREVLLTPAPMAYTNVTPPPGEKITIHSGKLQVPDHPVIPFIRGDGTGPDIWAASERVFDAAVAKAYGGRRKVSWFEVFAGETAKQKFDNWLPDDTVEAFKEFLVGIKGPLTTPVGGGIRSLNVALRQMLDLYVCLRPVQWFHRRAFAGEASGEGGHGDLPREHRGYLRRHRIRRRHARGPEGARFHRRRSFRRSSKRSASAPRRPPRNSGKRSGRRIFPATSRWASASSRSVTAAPCGWCTARSPTRSSSSARA